MKKVRKKAKIINTCSVSSSEYFVRHSEIFRAFLFMTSLAISMDRQRVIAKTALEGKLP